MNLPSLRPLALALAMVSPSVAMAQVAGWTVTSQDVEPHDIATSPDLPGLEVPLQREGPGTPRIIAYFPVFRPAPGADAARGEPWLLLYDAGEAGTHWFIATFRAAVIDRERRSVVADFPWKTERHGPYPRRTDDSEAPAWTWYEGVLRVDEGYGELAVVRLPGASPERSDLPTRTVPWPPKAADFPAEQTAAVATQLDREDLETNMIEANEPGLGAIVLAGATHERYRPTWLSCGSSCGELVVADRELGRMAGTGVFSFRDVPAMTSVTMLTTDPTTGLVVVRGKAREENARLQVRRYVMEEGSVTELLPAAGTPLWTTAERLNLRDAPPRPEGALGAIVAQVEGPGRRVELVEAPRGGWFRVRDGANVGWAAGAHLLAPGAADGFDTLELADLDLFVSSLRDVVARRDLDALIAACSADVVTSVGEGTDIPDARTALAARWDDMAATLDRGYRAEETAPEPSLPERDLSMPGSPEPRAAVSPPGGGWRFAFRRGGSCARCWRIASFLPAAATAEAPEADGE